MLPADQRLRPEDPPGLEVDLGLVVQQELPVLDPLAQLGDELQAARGGMRLARRVDRLARAGPLGRVHGDVGPPHQRLGVLAVLGEQGNADAGADVDPVPVHLDRPAQFDQHPLRDEDGLLPVRPRQEDGELVAAQAGHQVGLPEPGPQPRVQLLEDLVAVVVAERVVDILEAVQVDPQQRGRAAAGAGLGDGGLHRLARAGRGWAGPSARRATPDTPAGRRSACAR